MGLRLTVPGADYESRAIGFTPAVSDGLQGVFFLNESVEKARRNLVVGRAAASVFGAPEVLPGMLRMKAGTNYLQTDIQETAEMTILVVGKCPDTMADNAHRGVYVSNFGSASTTAVASYGVGLHVESATRVVHTATRYSNAESTAGTSGAAGSSAQNPAALAFLVGRTRDTRTEMNNLTQALSTAGNYTFPRYLSQGAMRIGSNYAASWQGLSDIGFVAIYNRFITDAERDAMYAQIKGYFSRRFSLTI
ncbi:hypothetical protein [Brevundimonas diminuta]|uniref:hypothetical protein n=1 Tax=Brevundimonas diminuta TaxID=293 RepID=UPI0032092F4C